MSKFTGFCAICILQVVLLALGISKAAAQTATPEQFPALRVVEITPANAAQLQAIDEVIRGNHYFAWSSNSSLMAVTDGDFLLIQDFARRDTWRLWHQSESDIVHLAFSPSNPNKLAVGVYGETRFLDTENGGLTYTVSHEDERLLALSQRWLLTDDGFGRAILRDVETGEQAAILSTLTDFDNTISQADIRPDESLIAVANRDGLWVWDIEAALERGEVGRDDAPLSGGYGASEIVTTFSADGTLLAAGGSAHDSRTLRLWSVGEGNGLTALEVPPAPDSESLNIANETDPVIVYGVAFHPRGEMLAAAGSDGIVRLWRIKEAGIDGEPLVEFSIAGALWTTTPLAFNADGTLLATLAPDGTLTLWGVPSE